MKLYDKWAVMIDVTNKCQHNCIYCCKHVRHIPYWSYMTIKQINEAIDSLKDYQGYIGVTGGEPLLHPLFEEICEVIAKKVPKQKAIIFTSHKSRLNKYKPLIDSVFGQVYINFHTRSQRAVCLHQPLLLAVGDMVKDEALQKELIDNCWCNRMWSPVINPYGAFFCDCAAGLEAVLRLGGGWSVESGWLNRDYQDQKDIYCKLCGMCLPYPAAKFNDREKISGGLYDLFRESGLINLEGMEIIYKPLTPEKIKEYKRNWTPWHNRQDRGYEGPEYINE